MPAPGPPWSARSGTQATGPSSTGERDRRPKRRSGGGGRGVRDVVPAGGNFGDYRIEARIGSGGMGVVYRAVQQRLNRPVALKVLPAELAQDPVYRSRFGREAAAVTVDQLHDVVWSDTGSPASRGTCRCTCTACARHWPRTGRRELPCGR